MSCFGNIHTRRKDGTYDTEPKVGECPDCGSDVDEHGECCEHDYCCYSPVVCKTCGYQPCQQYC